MNFDINNIKGTYYGKPEDTCYTITAKDYNELLKASQLLSSLFEMGMEEWEYFKDAVKIYDIVDRKNR